MIQRGRKSAAAQSVTVVDGGFKKRPEPPADLTERQASIWREVVASEPTQFFDTAATRTLLTDYCRHCETAEILTNLINTFKPEWIRAEEGAHRLNGLLKMRERETRAAVSMATKLRITNQSRYENRGAFTASRNTVKGPKPWEG